jgi:two-component system cell cycle sensor histidine kinase/response regulator CckA
VGPPRQRRRRAGQPRAQSGSSSALAQNLRSISVGLAKGLDINSVLAELLQHCSKAVGTARGAAYLFEADNHFSLRAQCGHRETARRRLKTFYDCREWLQAVVGNGDPVALARPVAASRAAPPDLLRKAGARSILVVPLILGKDRLGALVFLSAKPDMVSARELFTPAVRLELGQATALARAITLSVTSEQRFRDLVQGLDAIVWEAAASTFQFTFVSQKAEEILGYPIEQWLREKDFWSSHIHPDDRKRAVAYRRKAVTAGKHQDFEYRALAADGHTVWIRDTIRVVRDPDGRVEHLRGLMVDITERRQAELKLEERSTYLHALIENSPLAIVVLDSQHRVQMCNPAFERLFGYSESEVAGANLDEFIAPSERMEEAEDATRRVLSGETVHVTTQRRRKDGSLAEVEIHGVPLLAERKLIGVYAIYQDITERQQAERALRQSEAKFSRIFRSSPDAITISTLDDGRYIEVNDGFLRLSGYQRSEVIGRTAFELKVWANPAQRERLLARLRKQGRVKDMEFDFRVRSGEVRVGLLSAELIELSGESCLLIVVRDITERKQAEHALQESEERYRLLFESNPQPMWVYDHESLTFLAVNDAAVRHYGYSREEFLKMSIRDIRPPEEVPRLLHAVARVTPGLHKGGVWRHRKKDGAEIDVEITSHTVEFGGRRADLVLANDVTEQRHTQQLQEAVYRIAEAADRATTLSDLFNAVHEIVQRVMPARNFYIALYDEREDMVSFPYFVDEVDTAPTPHTPGRGLTEYVLRTGKSVLCTLELHQELERAGEIELVGVQSPIWLGVPLRIGEKVVGAMVVQHYSDPLAYGKREQHMLEYVSFQVAKTVERKRAEEALHKSEANYRSLVEGAPYGIYRADREGQFLAVNPALVQMLGYASQEELLASNLADDIYREPEERDRFIRQYWGQERFDGAEVNWKRKDGSSMIVRLGGRAARDEEGQLAYVEVMAEDVTERRTLERQLQQAQKMEAIGRLAGGIAHDFNNLLMVIQGHSELLRNRLAGEHAANVGEIQKAADRAAALTQQLLAFSRKQMVKPKVLDLNEVATGMESMVRRLIGEQIELVVVCRAGLGRARADQGQVEQIILNLAVNARDAMPQGGKLIIETGNVELDEAYVRHHAGARAGSYVMLAVSDTGMGMDKETQAHIFEPFFTTKEMGKGTGMGLSTVYGIVKQSDGYIAVYSEIGKGATFKVYFPRVDASAEAVKPQAAAAVQVGGTETVLLVEDEEPLRRLVGDFLEGHGYRVLTAASGGDALQKASQYDGTIHILVTDVVMPGMGGRQLVEKLSALRPGLKVLYMSGYTDEAIAHHGVLEPGVLLLQKPFTLAKLAQQLREVLEGRA